MFEEGSRGEVDLGDPSIEDCVAERTVSLQIAPSANAIDAIGMEAGCDHRCSAMVDVIQAYRTRFALNCWFDSL